ncbi:MAG: hypothetical protein HWN66_02600 [Candidatus Helarchaeota archaeon]|nr:hypothetical protein [Candidatus Helarchaeota archaeon]
MEENLWIFDPVPLDYAIRLCNVDKFSLFSFSGRGFLGFLKASPKWDENSPHFIENLLNEVGEAIKDEVVKEILRDEKNQLRPEKKQLWNSLRTKAPFYDRARGKSKVNSFEDAIELAQKLVNQLGPPWKPAKRGRPPTYRSEKITSGLLAKHFSDLSFDQLRAELKKIRFDCRLNPDPESEFGIPSKSELHWAMMKIPEAYLEEALRLLDEWTAESHGDLFGTSELNKFGVDGTSIQCDTLEEALIAGHQRFRRTTDRLNLISRLVTNTVTEMSSSIHENTKDLRKLLKMRKKSGRSLHDMEVVGDKDYDVEYNYQYATQNHVTVTIKPKTYAGKPYKGRFRRKAQANFSNKNYKTRKKVERPFGNMEMRDGNKLHYKRPDMKRKGELLRIIAHNMKAYFMQEAWAQVLTKFSIQTKCVPGDAMAK